MNWLLDPLQFNFIIRALIAAILVGIVCPILGTYVVLRGMAFFGDALAHTILPGVVLAFLFGWSLALGALIVGILTAVGIGILTEKGDLKEDTAIGVIFVGMFALGIAPTFRCWQQLHNRLSPLLIWQLTRCLRNRFVGYLWFRCGCFVHRLSLLQRVPYHLLRPHPSHYLAFTHRLLPLPTTHPHRHHHRHRPTSSRHRPSSSHVCHPCCHRLPINPPSPLHDGRSSANWNLIRHHRPLPLLLHEHRLRSSRCFSSHPILHPRLPIRPRAWPHMAHPPITQVQCRLCLHCTTQQPIHHTPILHCTTQQSLHHTTTLPSPALDPSSNPPIISL